LALYIEVTNSQAGVVGRAGYRFDPGETKTVMVAASRANELLDTNLLDTKIVSADNPQEVPEGHSVDVNATDAAKRTARQNGVDIAAVQGSGQGGSVTKDDVERFVSEGGELVKSDRDHYMDLHRAGGGTSAATTLDPKEELIRAQHEAIEALQRADAELRRTQAGENDPPAADEPSQPYQEEVIGQQPSPPVDVTENADDLEAPEQPPEG
jgi:pyruvate/2-oxoglutarate dehydrogenase complex dihydrolipoamide acyltransferase (E2) component